MLIGGFVSAGNPPSNQPELGFAFFMAVGALYLVLGGLLFWVGLGLRRLNGVGRIGGTIFGGLGLLAIPLGTLINGYLLYLLWSEKGNMVFTDQYKQTMKATLHIKHKTSVVAWAVLIILVLVFVLAIVAAILG